MMVPESVVSRVDDRHVASETYSLEIVKDRIILRQAGGEKIGQRECAKNA